MDKEEKIRVARMVVFEMLDDVGLDNIMAIYHYREGKDLDVDDAATIGEMISNSVVKVEFDE